MWPGIMTTTSDSERKLPLPLYPITLLSLLSLFFDGLWIFICAGPILLIAIVLKIFPKRKKNLKEKIVLVTGAANGLGRELSIQLTKSGCIIICVDINQEGNEETVKKISSVGGSGKAYYCDVSKPEQVSALAERVLDDFGKVDIVINNAGIVYRNGILTGDDNEIRKVLDVNYLSSQWVTRAFLPGMIKQDGGHIVFISSASGILSLGHGNVYSSTKFALLGMTYALIEEFRSNDMYKNIKVSCAMPYFINADSKYETNYWRIRLPALSNEKASKLIIEGIQKQQKIFTIPGMTVGYHFCTVVRLLPNCLYYKIRDKFYADFIIPDENIYTKL